MARKKTAHKTTLAAAAQASAGTHIALLRGINVGGKNALPMKELSAILEGAGCTEVRTYIQSGNAVFGASAALAAKLPALVARAILARAGHRVPVVMRSAEEWRALVKVNPFLPAKLDPTQLHVGFLADAPSAGRVAALDAQRSPPDEFRVRGREIYFRFPAGLGKSKLTNAYFDAKLATTLTVRNWRTVLKLLEMAAG
jgi:uncharacterized protein (DUF1697 family)